jgi:(R,R)-butanediol dehydrogenase/meso-butanediol dehydrogenase/diacetyl reductase
MKALRWHGRRDLRLDDVPEPSPGPGELKIRVTLAGICGTDLKEYSDGPVLVDAARAPLTLGHEFCGTVAAVGPGVKGFTPGDRVSGVGYRYCGTCHYCKLGRVNLCVEAGFNGLTADGCLAGYYVAPAYACYVVPDAIPDELAALVEPLAVGLHAVRQAKVAPGASVAVVGDGAIGLSALLAAKGAGAKGVYLVAKHRGRARLAERLGADAVLCLEDGDPVPEVRALTDGLGADAAVECVGYPDTPQLAVNLARPGGTISVAGVFEQTGTLDYRTITFSEKTIVGSSIYVDEGKEVIELLAAGRLDAAPLVSTIVPLERAVEEGFEGLLKDKENLVKVLVRVSGTPVGF